MVEQLASLLLPIDALLSHEEFNPQFDASPALVSLFRNMWFLCILFRFTSPDDEEHLAMEWLKPALVRIADKTPSIILEDARDSLSGDIEYNSVIRQEYAHTVGTGDIQPMRNITKYECESPGYCEPQAVADEVYHPAFERDPLSFAGPRYIPPHNA